MPLKKSTPSPSPVSKQREVPTTKPSLITNSPDKRHPGDALNDAPADRSMGLSVAEPTMHHLQTPQHIVESDQQAGETIALDDERALENKITALWSSHGLRRSEGTRNREQMRVIRMDLGRELSAYKKLLSRPGCGGNWAAFLRGHKIPRATANRYVKGWEDTQNPTTNRLSETIAPPSAEQIAALAKKMSAKLMKLLPTQDSRTEFLAALTVWFRDAPRLVTT